MRFPPRCGKHVPSMLLPVFDDDDSSANERMTNNVLYVGDDAVITPTPSPPCMMKSTNVERRKSRGGYRNLRYLCSTSKTTRTSEILKS